MFISVGNSMFCFGFGMKAMSDRSKFVHKAIVFQSGIMHHTSSINACYESFVLNFTHLNCLNCIEMIRSSLLISQREN